MACIYIELVMKVGLRTSVSWPSAYTITEPMEPDADQHQASTLRITRVSITLIITTRRQTQLVVHY